MTLNIPYDPKYFYDRFGQKWDDTDIDYLIQARCQPNPPTFRHICFFLNEKHNGVNPWTVRECTNKFHSLFPMGTDVNRTVKYIKDLQKRWPQFYWHTQTAGGEDLRGRTQLVALHLVWPWSKKLMNVLSPSVFCDATFGVTVYHYKVVVISTLDGENHIRPLMLSFIMNSTGPQWSTIFDIFHNNVMDGSPKMYVVTSDQERSIQSGLAMSQIENTTIQFFCSLHAKWNVRDHE